MDYAPMILTQSSVGNKASALHAGWPTARLMRSATASDGRRSDTDRLHLNFPAPSLTRLANLRKGSFDHRDEPRLRPADCPDDPVVKQSRELLRASRRLPALRAVNQPASAVSGLRPRSLAPPCGSLLTSNGCVCSIQERRSSLWTTSVVSIHVARQARHH